MLRRLPLLALAALAATSGVAIPATASYSAPHPQAISGSLTPNQEARYLASTRHHPVPRTHFVSQGALGRIAPQIRRVVAHGSVPTAPTLVYVQVDGTTSKSSIMARNLLTGAIVELAAPTTSACPDEPKLSPDGTKVVFLDYGPACTAPAVIDELDLTTSLLSTIVSPTVDGVLVLPNWSPDSSKILYTLQQNDSNGNFLSCGLYTVPATGGLPTAIGGGGVDGYEGVYSPDGTHIAYAPLGAPGDNELAIMWANGSVANYLTQTRLNSTYGPVQPAWSSDGSRLSYTYVKNTYTTADGTLFMTGIGVVLAGNDTQGHSLAAADPTTVQAGASTWSPDGTEVYYDADTRNVATGAETSHDAIFTTDFTGQRRATLMQDANHTYTGPQFNGPAPSPGTESTFTSVSPVRLLPRTPLGPGHIVDVQVAGGLSPVPAGATAVTLNLTGVGATAATYLQAYPKPTDAVAVPLLSNLNLTVGQTAAVAVQATVSADGYVRIRNQYGTVGVIVDISGYFLPGLSGDEYLPVPPVRAADVVLSPGTADILPAPAWAPNDPGFNAVAVVLNITGAGATEPTYLTAYPFVHPGNDGPPTVSNLNLTPHVNRANLVTVRMGDQGQVLIYNAYGTVRLIVDVLGYYGVGGTAGLAYHPVQPTRVVDTRIGLDTPLGATMPTGPGATLQAKLSGSATTSTSMVTVPETARAYVYNLTAVAPTTATYLTAYPDPLYSTLPTTSTLNVSAHAVVPNLAITATDIIGTIGVYNAAGSTPIVIDLAGYYAPPT